MPADATILTAILLASALMCGCGGGSRGNGGNGGGGGTQTAAPTISTSTGGQTGAQNGTMIVNLASATAGAAIYYTVDGSTPTTSSQQYQAPFLVASSLTVEAIAVFAGETSSVTSQSFTLNIQPGTLVWSDEFTSSTNVPAQPNPQI